MKRKDIKNLHQKSKAELTKELQNKKEQLVKMRLDVIQKPEKNTRLKSHLLDDIARIQTVLVTLSQKGEAKV